MHFLTLTIEGHATDHKSYMFRTRRLVTICVISPGSFNYVYTQIYLVYVSFDLIVEVTIAFKQYVLELTNTYIKHLEILCSTSFRII